MSARRADLTSRRKLVPCKKHGLHYDPDLHAGCVLCRKENPPVVHAVSVAAWRVWTPFVLAVLALATIVYFETRPEQAASAGSGLVKLEPRPYRTQIRTLEGVLYAPAFASGDPQVSDAADQLAAAIRHQERSAASAGAADRVASFGRDATQADAATARQSWEALRSEIFSPASWFEGMQETRPAIARVDRSAVEALRQTASFGERLVARGEAATALLPGGSSDAGSAASWNAWATTWQVEVDALARTIPPRPVTRDGQATSEATDALERARNAADALIEELRQFLPVGAGEAVPDSDARATVWSAARDTLDSLERALDRATAPPAGTGPVAPPPQPAAIPEASAADAAGAGSAATG